MASGQTENYGLNQWVAEDRILREEFNQDNLKIETAFETIKMVSACVTGSYSGTNSSVTVQLGFQPSFLVIVPTGHKNSYNTDIVGAFGFNGAMTQITRNMSCGLFSECHFTDSGFTISASSLTTEGLTFLYAAFY